MRGLVRRAEAFRLSGRTEAARGDLDRALALAPSDGERAYVQAARGINFFQIEESNAATDALREALELSERAGLDAIATVAAAHLSRLAHRRGAAAEASALTARADRRSGAAPPVIRAMVDLVRAETGNAPAAIAVAIDRLRSAPDGIARGQILLEAGALALALGADEIAERAYADAAGSAQSRIAALGANGLAGLAETRGAHRRAAEQAGRVLAVAQATGDDDLAFRAAWRRGRAFDALGEEAAALAAYRTAFQSLRRIRTNIVESYSAGQSRYRRQFGRFHQSYVDLLMRVEAGRGDEALLREARRVIEDLKIDEVEDYFQERCVPRDQAEVEVSAVADRTAVLYPIILEDRMELLVDVDGRVWRRSARISRGVLDTLARVLRFDLEIYGRPYESRAKALYDVLIRPVDDLLTEADTIVFVPDGVLRLIPIAALWDGEAFLIERYAIATVLGLSLVEPRPLTIRELDVLAAGATQIEGFAPLPSVDREMDDLIARLGAERLSGADFRVDRFSTRLQSRPYDVVHLATHAQIGGSPEENFVAATDGRIDMNRLALSLRARSLDTGEPVQLLTLSACATASGDDRAPLGLAGIAYRAGARSVLASLWAVFDVSTADLMSRFYEELESGLGRAAALQTAQKALLARSPDFRHPSVWAAFTIIGDWQ